MIFRHLLAKQGQRELSIPVLETNVETVDVGDIHLHSEYQAIKTQKCKEQLPNNRKRIFAKCM
jgi:hypothetical protein